MLPNLYEHFQRSGNFGVISDTHFGELDLRQGLPYNRPSDDEVVAAINRVVGRDGTLLHLGDVGDISYIKRIRAKHKILVMGNHDSGASNYRRNITIIEIEKTIAPTKDEALRHVRKKFPDRILTIVEETSTTWEISADNNLFDEVYEGAVMLGEKLIASHEPIEGLTWCCNLHGHDHSHNKHPDADRYHYNFNIDARQCGEPVLLNRWLKEGRLSKIKTIHRSTIDRATIRAKNKK